MRCFYVTRWMNQHTCSVHGFILMNDACSMSQHVNLRKEERKKVSEWTDHSNISVNNRKWPRTDEWGMRTWVFTRSMFFFIVCNEHASNATIHRTAYMLPYQWLSNLVHLIDMNDTMHIYIMKVIHTSRSFIQQHEWRWTNTSTVRIEVF
jgi:hypothetical protein